ncbi:MAG: SOS response-associated peptidase [Rhodospirillales bacterium]
MCARYENKTKPESLIELFDLATVPPTNFPDGDIRPTDRAMLITGSGAAVQPWGIPSPRDAKPLINARSETLSEKQTFRPLLQQRCLVPATAYYEWRKLGSQRLKNRIERCDEAVMIFAGLTDGRYFTIITCTPGPDVGAIHDRMPVILSRDAANDWIDNRRSFDECRGLLRPTPEQTLRATEDAPRQTDLFG